MYNISSYEIPIEPILNNKIDYVIREENTNNLISSISLAVCSIMLSLGGLIFITQKSRCSKINFCGLKCERTLEDAV